MSSPSARSFAASSALHLASLLDLSARLSDSDQVEPILNAVLLSIMGKLKIRKACVLRRDGDVMLMSHAKGVPLVVAPVLELDEPLLVETDDPDTAWFAALGLRWLIPLHCHGTCEAIVCLGPSFDNIEHDPDVRTYVDVVRTIASTALQNAKAFQSLTTAQKDLERRNLLVSTLFESARDFTGQLSVQEVVRLLTFRLTGQLMVSSYVLFLRRPLDGRTTLSNRTETVDLEPLAMEMHQITTAVIAEDLDADSSLANACHEHGIGVLVPLQVRGEYAGTLAIRRKLLPRPFTPEEIEFIESLGNTAMQALENIRLFREEQEKLRLEQDLALAVDIQRGLLPSVIPDVQGLDIAAHAVPSRHVGGDYYDVIKRDDGSVIVAIADVSGKGIGAALLMANVQAALNVLTTMDFDLRAIVERINALLVMNTEPGTFVTMFLAAIDGRTGHITYVNAGHNPPYLASQRGIAELTEGGVLLGVLDDPPPYRVGTTTLDDGDVLFLYTDGLTEARDHTGEEFGPQRCVDALKTMHGQEASTVIRRILEQQRTFTGERSLDDDTTILAVRRTTSSLP